MPRAKSDPDRADEKPAANPLAGAYTLGGVWYAANGRVLTAPETQQAHRAADKAAAEARAKTLRGEA